MKSWLPIPDHSDFSLHNIPFGIFCTKEDPMHRVGTRIGDTVVDVHKLAQFGYLDAFDLDNDVLHQVYLNDFIALGKEKTSGIRHRLIDLFREDNPELRDAQAYRSEVCFHLSQVIMLMPVQIGDYTDFYSSREHATNVGTMFRDPNNALLPNWLHLPVGYHGRSSSIVLSGTPVRRPVGQTEPAEGAAQPGFGPSRLLDFELEMAFVIGRNTQMGARIAVDEAENYIFGMVLFNDWSARDIQKWEYVPLGPFLAKNFASSISPWIVTLDALEPFRVQGPVQDPEPLPYLKTQEPKGFDIELEVELHPETGKGRTICRSNFRYMYWSMSQQLAHHTINGCNVRIGDMMASGTISGPTPDSYGSMLELTWRGSKPITMPDGTERRFIQDGDTVTMRGFCQRGDIRVGFGEVEGKVLPAFPFNA